MIDVFIERMEKEIESEGVTKHQLEEARDNLITILEGKPQDPCILAETQELMDVVDEKINNFL